MIPFIVPTLILAFQTDIISLCTEAEAVGEDAPLNILKIMLSLLCLALDKFPGVFHDNGISSIPYFFARVMQLVSLPKLR